MIFNVFTSVYKKANLGYHMMFDVRNYIYFTYKCFGGQIYGNSWKATLGCIDMDF